MPGSVLAIAIVAAAAVLVFPGAASALVPTDVKADGVVLDGSTQPDGEFMLSVDGPDGVKVKFKIDGEYLGQDTTQPYTWPISTSAGEHKVNVRWGEDEEREEVDVHFTVSDSGTPTPTPTPTTHTDSNTDSDTDARTPRGPGRPDLGVDLIRA